MAAPFVSRECAVLSFNRRVGGVVIAGACAGAVATAVAAVLAPWAIGIGVSAVVLSLSLVYSMLRYGLSPARQRGLLRADLGGVSLDGAVLVRREALAAGLERRPWGGRPTLLLLGRDGRRSLEIELPDEGAGAALLGALDLELPRATVVYDLAPAWSGSTAAIMLLGWSPILVAAPLLFGVMAIAERLGVRDGTTESTVIASSTLGAMAIAALWLHRKARVRLVVGGDGVHLSSLLRRRFLPYDEVSDVARWPGKDSGGRGQAVSEGFDLVLRSGERIRFRTMRERLRLGDITRDHVAEVIDRARRAHESRAAEDLSALERGARSAASWVAELRALAAGAGAGYRAPELPEDRLVAVLESPAAQAEQRAACAVVLAAAGVRGAADRVRAAAEAIASPSLRAAVVAAVGGDDAALEEALDRLARERDPR